MIVKFFFYWMYNPAGHPADVFVALFMRCFFATLAALCVFIYVSLLISVTNVSMHLMNIISITIVKNLQFNNLVYLPTVLIVC